LIKEVAAFRGRPVEEVIDDLTTRCKNHSINAIRLALLEQKKDLEKEKEE
jgi:hypothetical protein